jgi:chitodextrinase
VCVTLGTRPQLRVVAFAAVTPNEDGYRRQRPPIVILGVAALVVATIFGIVASLVSGPDAPRSNASVPPVTIVTGDTVTPTPSVPSASSEQTTSAPPAPIGGTDEPPITSRASKPPVGRFSFECVRDTGTCDFDGDGSTDPDGEVVRWTWKFGDGQDAEGAYPKHTFAKAGRYTVTMEVTDDSGTTDSAFQFVTIE